MIDLLDFHRLIQPIKNKIFLMLGRAIVKLINNVEGTQKIQVTGLKNETLSDVERLQEYGFESHPLSDSEAIIISLNGNRDQSISIKVHDRRYRPKTLLSGDVCMYDYRGVQVLIDATGLTLKSGDASGWIPNAIAVCPFTGAPHGGAASGIVKLKGG